MAVLTEAAEDASMPPDVPIRVLLVEDHDMVAEAIALALDRAADIEVVGRARSLETALADAPLHRPDVVLLDRRLPDGDGIPAIPGLRAASRQAPVLVLTGDAAPSVAIRVVEAGGAGLILKSAGLAELEAAVRQVATGGVVFSQGLLGTVLDQLTGRAARGDAALTPRERETLSLLGEGLSSRAISERLEVAHNTARNHVQRVLDKLGASSRLEAVVIARREGYLD
jgi:DNA-binding NarL/FixJ family response regulator